MFAELVISVFLVGILYLFYLQRRPKSFPPGPFSWPILGNLLQIGKEPHKGIMSMRSKYGDIIGIDLGLKRAVFLNEYKLIKEAFGSSVFSGRIELHHFAEPETGILKGILFTSGKRWVEQRRFAFSYLQSEFRNGIPMETFIKKEIEELIQVIAELRGKTIKTENLFGVAMINSLWSIITGKRYELMDPDFVKLINHVTYTSKTPATQALYVFYSKIVRMFPKISKYEEFQHNVLQLLNFMQENIETHKATFQEGVQRDYIDSYLTKIKLTDDPNSDFYGKPGESFLRHSLLDLFIAGSETVSSILIWTVFLMAHHPEVQEILYSVIDEVVGKTRLPSLSDRDQLPYVEAVVQEVLRFSSLLPLGVFHETTADVEFKGYRLPKGTVVVANQYGVHNDPEIWGDPENFRPERFLTEDGSEVIRHPALLAFSTGRRVCPGEALARDELFLTIASLFQRFKIEFNTNAPKPPLKSVMGTFLFPVDHEVVLHSRWD